MQIDVKSLTRVNFQLSNWNLNYKCSYGQGWLVLHLAGIGEVHSEK